MAQGRAIVEGEVWLRELGIDLLAEPGRLRSVITHRLAGPFAIAPHQHDEVIQFDIIRGASGRVVQGSKVYRFDRPVCLVSYPGARHGYELAAGIEGRASRKGGARDEAWVVNLKFEARPDSSILGLQPLPPIVVLGPDDDRVLQEAERFVGLPDSTSGLPFEHVLAFLALLAAWPRGKGLGTSGRTDRPIDRSVLTAVSIIEERLDDPPSLEELAERTGVSVRHLARLFLKHVGQSPARYMAARRLDRARVLLLESERAISEVADAMGFSSPSTFSRWFRKAGGTTPQAFRRDPTVF